MSTLDLTDTVAIVTGAGNGIGLDAALAFRDRGATVIAADLDPSALEGEAHIVTVVADVTSDSEMAELARIASDHGEVAVVMANAGVAAGGRIENVPIEEWHRLLDVNVLGVVRTIQPHLAGMRARGRGHLVVTGSSAGLFSEHGGGNASYATTKAALLGFTRALAHQVAADGLSTHYLAPRLTDTAFPVSAVAWGRSGSRVMSDRSIDDADTVEAVTESLLNAMVERRFLVSLTPDTEARLTAFARTGSP